MDSNDETIEIRRELTDQYAALWTAMPGFRNESGWYCIWSTAEDLRGFWVDDSPEFLERTEMHLIIALAPPSVRGYGSWSVLPPSPNAHEVTEADAAMMRSLSGASFGPTSSVILPSGRKINGQEMQRWIKTVRTSRFTTG